MQHILVVDDSKAVHAYIESLLDAQNIRRSHVYSGEEALQFMTQNKDVDLILLDWEMPGMIGPDTAKEIRDLGYRKFILMITTRNSPSDIRLALSCGIDDFMMKPFTRDILISKIEALAGEA